MCCKCHSVHFFLAGGRTLPDLSFCILNLAFLHPCCPLSKVSAALDEADSKIASFSKISNSMDSSCITVTMKQASSTLEIALESAVLLACAAGLHSPLCLQKQRHNEVESMCSTLWGSHMYNSSDTIFQIILSMSKLWLTFTTQICAVFK